MPNCPSYNMLLQCTNKEHAEHVHMRGRGGRHHPQINGHHIPYPGNQLNKQKDDVTGSHKFSKNMSNKMPNQIWWAENIKRRYYQSLSRMQKKKTPYICTFSFWWLPMSRSFPSILMLVITTCTWSSTHHIKKYASKPERCTKREQRTKHNIQMKLIHQLTTRHIFLFSVLFTLEMDYF